MGLPNVGQVIPDQHLFKKQPNCQLNYFWQHYAYGPVRFGPKNEGSGKDLVLAWNPVGLPQTRPPNLLLKTLALVAAWLETVPKSPWFQAYNCWNADSGCGHWLGSLLARLSEAFSSRYSLILICAAFCSRSYRFASQLMRHKGLFIQTFEAGSWTVSSSERYAYFTASVSTQRSFATINSSHKVRS